MRGTIVCLSLGALLGCGNGLGPAIGVTGTWTHAQVEGGLTLDLVQKGASVSGTGTSYTNSYPPITTFSITGIYSRPNLTLTFSNNGTVLKHFTGSVLDAFHLIEVITASFCAGTTSPCADTLMFVRR